MLYLGLMSGTSLDGVDLALCRFSDSAPIAFEILAAETLPYTSGWEKNLKEAPQLSGKELIQLDRAYGSYLGGLCKSFITKSGLSHHITICSHGHTVFHAPADGYTLQIGQGSSLREAAGHPVIFDFRSADVAAGGQGAPLVPIADRDLFPSYHACLNLGGFANISFFANTNTEAFDICPCNTLLNLLAAEQGSAYDDGGGIARSGKLLPELFSKLNAVPIYHLPSHPSLSLETLDAYFFPLLKEFQATNLADRLHTLVHHIAWQIILAGKRIPSEATILITGGGAYNSYLVEMLNTFSHGQLWQKADPLLIEAKEALAFAYLGFLHTKGKPANLPSVTHASGSRILGTYCP